MGKKDILTTSYISVKERFADAINTGVFHGKQMIAPEQIQEIDTASKMVLRNREKTKNDTGQVYRDILKTAVYGTNFCIIGIEHQSEIHYVFPVRSMLYDAMNYKKQWNEIEKEHRGQKDLQGAEFLSGFSKEDTLRAVVTLVVYFGTEPWDGASDIHSLIDWTDIPEEFKEIVPNYSIHLLELNKYENLEDFQSDLKLVGRFLQNSDSVGQLKNMLEEHEEEFRNMEEDTYDLIGTLGNMNQVKKLKNRCKTEKGGFNMCKGMEEWLEEREAQGEERGELRGEARTKRIFKLEKEGKSVEEIAEICGVSVEKVQKILE